MTFRRRRDAMDFKSIAIYPINGYTMKHSILTVPVSVKRSKDEASSHYDDSFVLCRASVHLHLPPSSESLAPQNPAIAATWTVTISFNNPCLLSSTPIVLVYSLLQREYFFSQEIAWPVLPLLMTYSNLTCSHPNGIFCHLPLFQPACDLIITTLHTNDDRMKSSNLRSMADSNLKEQRDLWGSNSIYPLVGTLYVWSRVARGH